MLLLLLEHGVGRCGDGHRWRRFRQRGTGHGPQLKGLEREKEKKMLIFFLLWSDHDKAEVDKIAVIDGMRVFS